MNSIPSHSSLHALANEQEWWFAASECHGILSALVALTHQNGWRDILFAGNAPTSAAFIPAWCDNLDAALASPELAYRLLLPEDGNCRDRAQALVQWTEGFLLAVHYLQRTHDLRLDAEEQAFIEDLQQLATLDSDLADDEDNLRQLTDLEEHCRMGVLMLHATQRKPSHPPGHTLH